jgi:hypothetical protein
MPKPMFVQPGAVQNPKARRVFAPRQTGQSASGTCVQNHHLTAKIVYGVSPWRQFSKSGPLVAPAFLGDSGTGDKQNA